MLSIGPRIGLCIGPRTQARSVFSGLERLSYIKLSDNKLDHLDNDLLGHLISLSHIDLSRNKISDVSDLHLPPSLQKIDLSFNKIDNNNTNIFPASSTYQVNYAVNKTFELSAFLGCESFESQPQRIDKI